MYIVMGFIILLLGIFTLFMGSMFLNYSYSLFLDFELVSVNSFSFSMIIYLDSVSLIFMSCVFLISSMVVFYSHLYMYSDKYSIRFLFLVLMFILSMMFMIISPNLISILLGWDGLGLVSYGLVIYFQNYKSYNAGMLTILTNRLGDVAILMAIAWMSNYGGWNFLFCLNLWDNYMYYILILLIFASFTKSAQIPFSSWLPAAMAAPTPVSALVHSSTLVTAGVYLMIRFSNLFSNLDLSLFALLGALTMFMSGLGANFEFDLKKIIALSTLSQLGMMMSILFMGFSDLAYFHLLTHAFFKSLLFLCSGLIIHVMSDSQDIRHMGGVMNYIPWTCSCFYISNISLCGLPFMSGFYSKDLILENMIFSSFNSLLILIFYVSVGFTSMYTIRLIYFSLVSHEKMFICQSYSEGIMMILPMIFLTFMSVMFGSILSWLFFTCPDILVLGFTLKILPFLVVLLFSWLMYELCLIKYNYNLYSLTMYYPSLFLGSMWFMPYYSTHLSSFWVLTVSKNYYLSMDMGWGEYLFSKFFYNQFSYFSSKFDLFHFNNAKLFLISFLILFFFMLV
uniref:NADH-ubiquinone oxidoreductase chain 5 n=1 Tax=Tetraphleps aterrimus TaxID=452413 RepID=A0A4D6P0G1_9HEMI|nr:NADH dehydrogenase subunit 5 [Tetraphleps aterrimus]QCE31842.1 NADH dehydrogenase subunit 5 [Tetraphleps aterrimus]